MAYDLGRREYWYRLWVLQELVLARLSPTLLCGTSSLSFSDYAAVSQRTITTITSQMLTQHHFDVYPNFFIRSRSFRSCFNQDSVVDILGNMRRICQWETIRKEIRTNGSTDLAALISSGILEGKATEHRDYVFAVRGMLAAEAQRLIPVDYSLDRLQVYHNAMIAMLSSTKGSADWLSKVSFYRPTSSQSEVPSWVPDFSRQRQKHDQGTNRGGRTFASKTAATGGRCLLQTLASTMISPDTKTLILSGVYFDEVSMASRIPFGGRETMS